jgi:hypothetical protein
MKFSEFLENPDNCSGFGFYIYNMLMHFLEQMSFLYTGGIQQIIPTKKFEDGRASIFAFPRQGRY